MIKIVSNREMQQMDAHTIQKLSVPGVVLMENAGYQTFEVIRDLYLSEKMTGVVHIYCGKGNNGGDGYVIARHLFDAGIPVQILAIGDAGQLTGDAALNYAICKNFKIKITQIKTARDLKKRPAAAIVVDALLGTGIHGAARGLFAEVIDHINHVDAPIIAVDIPSGLSGDSGKVEGPAVYADSTVTMALPKRAHIFYPARDYCGDVHVADIGIPHFLRDNQQLTMNYVEKHDIDLPLPDPQSNKYSTGKIFILGGSAGMSGAAILAAGAAARCGAGLVYLGVPQSMNNVAASALQEVLSLPLPETARGNLALNGWPQIEEKLAWADVVLVGPGAGREKETCELMIKTIRKAKEIDKPLVVDADGLYALSEEPALQNELHANCLLTPHHGEFRRLCGADRDRIQFEPWDVVKSYMGGKQLTLNLKGGPSIVADAEGRLWVNGSGNAALAKGGSGDVLAGMSAAFMARGLNAGDAAVSANFIHGYIADQLVEKTGYNALLPGDIISALKTYLKEFE